MKKLLVGLLLLSFSISAMAEKTYTCKDLYQMKLRDRAHKLKVAADITDAAFIASIATLIATTEVPPVMVVAFMSSLATYAAAGTLDRIADKQRERAKSLDVLAKRFYRRILRKRPNATESDIDEALERGFSSGYFCRNYSLSSQREIKNYVLGELK